MAKLGQQSALLSQLQGSGGATGLRGDFSIQGEEFPALPGAAKIALYKVPALHA